MPPKPGKGKDAPSKKPIFQILRPSISNSSLNKIPDDAIEGFQERIYTGINWILKEESVIHHKGKCVDPNKPEVTFTEALQNCIRRSILHEFLEENNISLVEQWEFMLPMVLWDIEKFGNEEKHTCYNADNSITDNIIQLIKKAALLNNRDILKKDFENVSVLRLLGAKMTVLDKGLEKFKLLSTLNLCGNYISDINTDVLPEGLKILQLQSNFISNIGSFVETLPKSLIYLGLAANFINDDSLEGLHCLQQITVLDLGDNDIYDLNILLNSLAVLPNLISLELAGNPCSVCAAYARTTLMKLPQLRWLDSREVLETDRSEEPFEPHPDDLRAAYFSFSIFRVISVPPPPKPEKGATTAFHVELEIPLLDSSRRMFLMFREHESLIEYLPPPEDEEVVSPTLYPSVTSKNTMISSSLQESDIYNHLEAKNSREIIHYTVYESSKVQWNKILNFAEPAVKIFCPDLTALRDTFRTNITVRVVYTVTTASKQGKTEKRSAHNMKQAGEQRVTLATIRCALRRPDWTQTSQHFHWDDTLGTEDAIHWGDGDLSVLQYSVGGVKTPKSKTDSEVGSKQLPPDNLTCHFGFGIETIRV